MTIFFSSPLLLSPFQNGETFLPLKFPERSPLNAKALELRTHHPLSPHMIWFSDEEHTAASKKMATRA
jgi:hypothetical protein